MFTKWVRGLWLDSLKVTAGCHKAGEETSGTLAVKQFFEDMPLGITVFWAVRGAGKRFAVCREHRKERVVCIDWYKFTGSDPQAWFAAEVGWKGSGDRFEMHTTVVFMHFDMAMAYPGPAKQLLLNLAADRTARFNVLVCVDSAVHAHAILQIKPHKTALLGPAYCGRCTEKQALDAGVAPDCAFAGTLGLAALTVSSSLLELRAAQADAEWREGEALLGWYRRPEAMV